MPKEKKAAVGETALDAFFSTTAAEQPADKPELADTSKKSGEANPRFTVRINQELQDRVRNAVYWDRDTITNFVESALEAEIQRREKKRGEPYPTREAEIRPGRPVR